MITWRTWRPSPPENHPWCLATLVKAEGSSYRQPGARVVVHPDGRGTVGLLSAGGLEEEIALQGGDVMERGTPRLVEYDTRKLFGCDGKLFIYPEKSRRPGRPGIS